MSSDLAMFPGYRWRNRLLLIFAPDNDDEDLRRQHEMLVDARRILDERQTVVITVTRDTVSSQRRAPVNVSATDLRNAYGIGRQNFEILLIGKDGGLKLRQGEPLSVTNLIALIDSMPMRQREMRENS